MMCTKSSLNTCDFRCLLPLTPVSVNQYTRDHSAHFPVIQASCVWYLVTLSPLPHSLHLSVRWVSPPPGWGASLPHPVPWAVSWLVRGGTSGGFHHWLTVGPGEAYHGKTEQRTPGQWFTSGWLAKQMHEGQINRRDFKRFKGILNGMMCLENHWVRISLEIFRLVGVRFSIMALRRG